jgi:signal transduction histidine kinase
MARDITQSWRSLPEQIVAWAIFLVVLLFTCAFFFGVPYVGFNWEPTGEIFAIYVEPPLDGSLHLNDRLVRVGDVNWSDFRTNMRLTLFDQVEPGAIVPVVVVRDEQLLSVDWPVPGLNRGEFLARLNSQWWLPYAFWLTGTATLLFLRPRDARWYLLIAFNYLTALWLVTGSGPSRWHIWESAIVMRAAIWLCVPVYWQLHWVFPQPLRPLPAPVWWVLYAAGAVLAVAEWFQLLPPRLFYTGFLLAVAGSLALLVMHFALRPRQRRTIGLLVAVVASALVPPVVMGVASLATPLPQWAQGASLLALPAVPFAYLYAAYRHQLGGVELRANRLVSVYLFLVLLSTALMMLGSTLGAWLGSPATAISLSLLAGSMAAICALVGFAPFQRLVERRLLGIPQPPTYLIERYAARITTTLDEDTLVRLLTQEVLPSLLIRQSTLVRWDAGQPAIPLYRMAISPDQLPAEDEMTALRAEARRYRAPPAAGVVQPCPWVRLVLPLTYAGELIGLWLLGRRDPDDFYSQAEVPTLKALADQTAVALVNIAQADRLHMLYQANIERQEVERANLAWVLHDEVLNDLALLYLAADEDDTSKRFDSIYQSLKARVRRLIRGLRPAALTYGLGGALEELATHLRERAAGNPAVQLDLADRDERYPPDVEQHLFRIVQQAAENALRHAQATTICIRGQLEPELITLHIDDNGVGFALGDHLDLSYFLAQQQFGLAGMLERAAIVNAEVRIESAPGRGTRVQVAWPATSGRGRA